MVIFRPFPHVCTLKPVSRLECRAQSPIYSCICFLSIIVFVVPSQCRSFVVRRRVVVEKIFRQMPCFRSHVTRTRHTSPWLRTRASSTSATSPSMNCASPHHFLSLRVLYTLGRLRYTRHCIYARHLHSSDSPTPTTPTTKSTTKRDSVYHTRIGEKSYSSKNLLGSFLVRCRVDHAGTLSYPYQKQQSAVRSGGACLCRNLACKRIRLLLNTLSRTGESRRARK